MFLCSKVYCNSVVDLPLAVMMETIKKIMQTIKLEKENALDRAEQLDQKLAAQILVYETVNNSNVE